MAATRVSVVKIVNQTCAGEVFLGSGFATKSGILTNAHVVEDARLIQVTTDEGDLESGRVTRVDLENDLALLSLEGTLPPPVKWSSKPIRVGDEVGALGFPRGMGFSSSRGSISSLDADFSELNGPASSGLIQTDTSINHGNSGGPLINGHGEAVGVVVAKRDDSEGIGFAIDGRVAQLFLDGFKGQRPSKCTNSSQPDDAVTPEPQLEPEIDKPADIASVAPGDLGISGASAYAPPCDGRYIVVLQSVTVPPYDVAVSQVLRRSTDASYFRTAGTCRSLRWNTDDGGVIYVVYTGPYDSVTEACSHVRGSAYVRQLSDSTTTTNKKCSTRPKADGAQSVPEGSADDREDLQISGASAEVPPCDGSFVVVLRSATEPATYRQAIAEGIRSTPGAKYFRTFGKCASIRDTTTNGNEIYAVYLGPFTTVEEACANAQPPSYVKQLSDSVSPTKQESCG